ncbi:Esterase [Tolypocladium ophioglossoides CBS 100239]|uniref:Esterase n=1 Tax=Tolypocladium ophioglossoides (strain CBS 100239) TaxID=1163406 RepID=A0A0L0NA95_TOLOC|nr:Esterase [Tolypocladium ophioglossoides CBS 100239]
MASFKAYIFSWIIWWTRKGIFQSPEALNKQIKIRRMTQDHRPPEPLRTRLIIEQREVGGFPVYEVSPKSETPNKARILYLHGGAFVFEISPLHWELVATLAERLQAAVTLPIYPLGPEYKLKDMYDMLQPLHDEMASSSDDSPFFVMGDSAGGTMTLVLTQQALKANTPIAKRLVAITPSSDATLTNPELYEAAKIDPWLDVPGCDEAMKLVCGDWERDDSRVSPVYGDLDQLPPMMVFAGELDLLTPDTRLFVGKVREKKREVVLIEGKRMMHVWPLLPIPEGAVAVDQIVQWLEQAV